MSSWIYSRASQRYYVTRDGAAQLGLRAGTFISEKRRVELRDSWTEAQKVVTNRLALDYDNGNIPLSKWVLQMREEVKISYIEQYVLGVGGRNNMTQADWGRLGAELRKQYGFLQEFGNDLIVKEPPLTLAQIQSRARQYIDGSTAMYERARVLAAGLPELPAYPADGSQNCKSNCKCNWRIEDMGEAWHAYWELEQTADHCETCLSNNALWQPLVVAKP